MAWNHLWGSPELLTTMVDRVRTYVPRQSCLLCGTMRNPFNNVITRFSRDRQCRDNPEPREPQDFEKELRYVREQLESLKRQGDPADLWHTGRKRRRSPEAPELPLPYKD